MSLSFEPFALWHAARHSRANPAAPLVVQAGGRVVGADPAARRSGIEIGMGLSAARARSAELRELPAASPELRSAWRGLLTRLHAFTPRLDPAAPGVVYLQLDEPTAGEVAAAFDARAGAAACREHARLLSLASRPGRIRSGGAAAVARLPLRVLRGLGIAAADLQRLSWLGLERLGELQSWSPAQLGALFGPGGAAVIRCLHGPFEAHIPLFTPPATVGAHFAFDDPACEPARLEPVLGLLVRRAAAQLGDRAAGHLTVRAVAEGIDFQATRIAKSPLRAEAPLERLARLALADSGAQPLGIDEIALELGGLLRPSRQEGLWRRRERLEQAVTEVERRYPGGVLRIERGDPFALAFEHRTRLTPWRSGVEEHAFETDTGRGRSAQRIAESRG